MVHTRPQLFCKLKCGDYIQRRACPDVKTLGVKHFVHHRKGLGIRDVDCTREIVNEGPQILRDASLANT